MFCTYTLPWYWKGLIVAYDLYKCFVRVNTEEQTNTALVSQFTLNVFYIQTMFSLVLVAPSLCLSVANRVETNNFVSEMVLLLASYLLLIRFMQHSVISMEHTCFCLQFCSCYFFYCFHHSISDHVRLLLGKKIVSICSIASMILFPVFYSHLLKNCMHLSPYVLVFAFSGEISGFLCTCISQVLFFFEHVFYALYERILESM